MNKARRGRVGLLLGSLVLALRALAAEQVSGTELARCAAVSAPDERLACYDKLAGRSAQKSPAAAASAPKTPSAAPPTVPTGAAAPAGAADAAAIAAAASRFGLPPPPATVPEPAKIEARITRVNADRQGNATLILNNGQTWSVQAPDQWLQPGDNVTIRQAALGSYLLTTPARHTYRVHRVQ
jgi:hypothetical protein